MARSISRIVPERLHLAGRRTPSARRSNRSVRAGDAGNPRERQLLHDRAATRIPARRPTCARLFGRVLADQLRSQPASTATASSEDSRSAATNVGGAARIDVQRGHRRRSTYDDATNTDFDRQQRLRSATARGRTHRLSTPKLGYTWLDLETGESTNDGPRCRPRRHARAVTRRRRSHCASARNSPIRAKRCAEASAPERRHPRSDSHGVVALPILSRTASPRSAGVSIAHRTSLVASAATTATTLRNADRSSIASV